MTYQRVELGLVRRFGGAERDLHAQQASKAYLSSRGAVGCTWAAIAKKQGECETQRHQWHRRVGLCMHYQMLRGHLPSPNIAPANEGGRLNDAVCCGYGGEEIEIKNNESAGAASGEVRAIVCV